MELKDLTQEELLAFIGMVKYILEGDGRMTTPETDGLSEIVETIGSGVYRNLLAQVKTRFSDSDNFRAFLKTIQRREAQELIVKHAKVLAGLDSVSLEEEAILDWLSEAWGVY